MDLASTNSSFISLSQLTKVEFFAVQDQYCYNEDLFCRYSSKNYVPQDGDRVSIYKTGWEFVKDYFLFEWAPLTTEDIFGRFCVKFTKECLPKDDKEYYQFCFISSENEVVAVSNTFQFVNRVRSAHSEMTPLTLTSSISYHQEMETLREENEILKESLKMFMAKKNVRNYDREISELKTMIYGMKEVIYKHTEQVDFLQNQMKVCLDRNRALLNEKLILEERCKNHTQSSTSAPSIPSTTQSLQELDLGDLESIPPFPFAK